MFWLAYTNNEQGRCRPIDLFLSKLICVLKDKQQIIDDTIRTLLNSLTVSEFMKLGHMADDFLIPEDFRCATDAFHLQDRCRFTQTLIQLMVRCSQY